MELGSKQAYLVFLVRLGVLLAELGVYLVDLDFTRSFTRHLAAPQEGTLLPSFRPQAAPKEGIPPHYRQAAQLEGIRGQIVLQKAQDQSHLRAPPAHP